MRQGTPFPLRVEGVLFVGGVKGVRILCFRQKFVVTPDYVSEFVTRFSFPVAGQNPVGVSGVATIGVGRRTGLAFRVGEESKLSHGLVSPVAFACFLHLLIYIKQIR